MWNYGPGISTMRFTRGWLTRILFLGAAFAAACNPKRTSRVASAPVEVAQPRPGALPAKGTPYVLLSESKLRTNARVVREQADKYNAEVIPVVKMFAGREAVARIFFEEGYRTLADSRVRNLSALNEAKVGATGLLIRSPAKDDAAEAVRLAETIVVTSTENAGFLDEAMAKQGLPGKKKLLLFVEQGDLREGVYPLERAIDIAKAIESMNHVSLVGVGSHLGSLNGVKSTPDTIRELDGLRGRVSTALARDLPILSAGNSSTYAQLEELSVKLPGGIPKGFQLRVGFTLFFGLDGNDDATPLKNLSTDLLRLGAEILEIERKPAAPWGVFGTNAFGEAMAPGVNPLKPLESSAWRAVLNIGKQDVDYKHLTSLSPVIDIRVGSSDHLVVEIKTGRETHKVGDIVEFGMDYSAALQAMNSAYVALRLAP